MRLPAREDHLAGAAGQPGLAHEPQELALQHRVPAGVEEQLVDHPDSRAPPAPDVLEPAADRLGSTQLEAHGGVDRGAQPIGVNLDVGEVEDRACRRRGAEPVDRHDVDLADQPGRVHGVRESGVPLAAADEELDVVGRGPVEAVQPRRRTVAHGGRVTQRQQPAHQSLLPGDRRADQSHHSRPALLQPALVCPTGDGVTAQLQPA